MTVAEPARARPSEDVVGGHPAWCAHHSGQGCLGRAVTLPGSRITVWLTARTPTDPRLLIESPGELLEVPVEP